MKTDTLLAFRSHLTNILLPTAPDISSFFHLVERYGSAVPNIKDIFKPFPPIL